MIPNVYAVSTIYQTITNINKSPDKLHVSSDHIETSRLLRSKLNYDNVLCGQTAILVGTQTKHYKLTYLLFIF